VAKKKSDDEESGYSESLDVVLGEVALDDKHIVQIRAYDGGAKKMAFFYRGAKKLIPQKRLPVTLAVQLAEAIVALGKAGALD